MSGEKTQHFKYETTDTAVIVFNRATGEKKVFNFTSFSEDIKTKLIGEGLKKKLSADAAVLKDTGEKWGSYDSQYQDLLDGVWVNRSSGADGLSKAHLEFAEAAAKAFGKDLEKIKAALLAMEPDGSNAAGNIVAGERTMYVRGKSKNPKIAAILAEIAAKKANERAKNAKKAAKEDLDDDLDIG
jgi:hypothetical protein